MRETSPVSKFFEPVEFEEPKDPADNRPTTVVTWDKDMLDKAWEAISAEITKIKRGTSDFYKYAVNPGSFGFPAENSIKIFLDDPSDKTFEGIREICKQDFKGAGEYFYQLLKACREEKDNG
jgi:hypothetical protein